MQHRGNFNICDLAELSRRGKPTTSLRRDFYKIIFIRGNIAFRCAGKSYEVNGAALLFVNPDVPYLLERRSDDISGYYCIFTADFFNEHLRGSLANMAVFAPDAAAPHILNPNDEKRFSEILDKVINEITTDYLFKYDLIRNYVTELILQAMKLRSFAELYQHANSNSRITAVFRDLLERQFPISSNAQQLTLSASQFAGQLNIHVNHLNRAVRTITGKTTTMLIMERLLSEAKALLNYTDWNVADIGYCLGFVEIANFNHFLRNTLR